MRPFALIALAATALAGCEAMQSMWGGGPKATASLQPTQGSTVRGTVNFEQRGEKLRVAANVSGLQPHREFGFRVHELGDCSRDGMNAKGPFRDLPSLKSNAYGDANLTADVDVISVRSGAANIVGRSLIVHAGARSACGVIQRLS